MSDQNSIIVAMSGSSGAILGIRLLERLKELGWETHLVISEPAKAIIAHETSYEVEDVKALATHSYDNKDFFSPIASGSFRTKGMVIAPCSMKTRGGIASGYSENLLLRAADVCLKERRRLVLLTRETPLSHVHIRNMDIVSSAGAVVLTPMLSFYTKPETVDDIIDQVIGKTLDALEIDNDYKRW